MFRESVRLCVQNKYYLYSPRRYQVDLPLILVWRRRLETSEIAETRAFVRSFVKEIVVRSGRAAILDAIPTPEDSPIGGADTAEVALNGRVMSTVRSGGRDRTRTCGLTDVNRAL